MQKLIPVVWTGSPFNGPTPIHILEYSRADIVEELAKLAVVGGLGKTGESEDELCTRFIEKIKSMNNNMNIPTFIVYMWPLAQHRHEVKRQR